MKGNKNQSLLDKAILTIIDLTEDTDYLCERIQNTLTGCDWCKENCSSYGPNAECVKKYLSIFKEESK